MRRPALSWSLGLIIVSALVYWIGSNTEWVDVTVPMPPTGKPPRILLCGRTIYGGPGRTQHEGSPVCGAGS